MRRSVILALVLGVLLAGSPAASQAVKTTAQFDAMRWPTATMHQILPARLAKLDASLHTKVADVTALKAIPATDRADGMVVLVKSGAGSIPHAYAFHSTSTAAGDNDLVAVPTSGTGRWYRLDGVDTDTDTTYTAGVGLALTGTVFSLPLTCSEGNVLAWNETDDSWDCTAPAATGIPLISLPVDGGLPVMTTTGELATSIYSPSSFATSSQGSKADTAMQPVVPLVPHSIATLAGTTGVPEDSQMTTAMFTQIKRVRITGPADGAAHDTTLTIPADAIVLDAWAVVVTGDSDPGGLTLDVGPNGNVDGYLNNVPIDTTGGGLCTPVLDGTSNWFISTLCGDLLSVLVAGTNADDRGLWSKFPDVGSGGVALAYQASGAAEAAVIDVYLELALPQ